MNVVVTGASAGIGRATAAAYAARGASVGLIARRADRLDEVAAEVARAGGRAAVAVADVGDRAALEAAIASVGAEHGPADVLVANAGMPGGAPFAELDVATIERVARVNYLGVVVAIKAVLPDMLERGSGSIVVVSSIAGLMGAPRAGAYVASKFALTGLCESLWFETAGTGVHVVSVHPGPIRTESWPHAGVSSRLVLEPEAVARAIIRAVECRRPRATVPAYYAPVAALRGSAPAAYRALLHRFARRAPGAQAPD